MQTAYVLKRNVLFVSLNKYYHLKAKRTKHGKHQIFQLDPSCVVVTQKHCKSM